MIYLNTKTRLIAGFTLIELLITVAIIGILAGIGIPAYSGYITSTAESAGRNDLRAISLMQTDFFNDNNALINTNLFAGRNTLDTTSAYNYTIVNHATGFQARATSKPGENLETYCIDGNNQLLEGNSC